MGEIGRDFRMGFRVLLRSPMVALASVVTFGLGIGGTTAVFSVADGVLFNPMNFPESNRLFVVLGNFSYDNILDLQISREMTTYALLHGSSRRNRLGSEGAPMNGRSIHASWIATNT